MRVTGFGFRAGLFYLAMVAAFVATPYSNLFFLLLAFLTLQWLACSWWTQRNLKGVCATIQDNEPIASDGEGRLRVEIEAKGRRRYQVAVELVLESGVRAYGQVAVLEKRGAVDVRIPTLSRGIYAVRRAYLSTCYPLGLFEARRELQGLDELVVYPRAAERSDARGSSDVSDVLGESMNAQGDLQPAGLRDFRDGDELRSVHWRASARRGTLVIKEWEGGGGNGLELLLDRRTDIETLEEALRQISAVVTHARENKELLVLTSQDLQGTFGEGHRPWREALRFLAGAQPLSPDGPPPPAVSPSVKRLPAVAHVR